MKAARLRLGAIAAVALVTLCVGALPSGATTAPQSLPFAQNWSNTGLITLDDNWDGVPGVVAYRGDDLTTTTGTDPQTVTAEGSGTPLDVNANQMSPNTFTTGGVAEFEIGDNPVVALQGSGTADAPHVLFNIDTTGLSGITVAYNLRDIDGSADDAVQPVALQFRVGSSGVYTNVPAGFVVDASTGPSLGTQVTAVSAVLPAGAGNQPLVQVRVITTNAVGSDEWIGIDDVSITGASDAAPTVSATIPANNATGVVRNANIAVAFSEPVTVTADWYDISCTSSGTHTATQLGGPASYQLDPDSDFAAGETCTVTIAASHVTDQDGTPTAMASDYEFKFTIAAAPQVVISQVYGGGGNSGATLKNDFIELYNRGSSAVSLNGWSVQYAAAAGTTWQVTPLTNVSLQPGRYYLVQEAAGAAGTVDLPTPDATGTIAMSATAGKVALVNTTIALSGSCPPSANIMDFVGYGTTANCFEGSGPTPAPSNTTAALRNNGGATDTNNNSADFTVGAPNPRSLSDPAPAVASTTPTTGATGVPVDANISITFSEAVNVSAGWYSISCSLSGSHTATSSGGPTSFTLDPGVDFANGESCTVTVFAANVTDQDTNDPPDNMQADFAFSFQTVDALGCGDAATPIHEVQGSGAASPIAGSAATIEGVVVGDYQQTPSEFNGFYVQEEDSDVDADPATSEGIFVFGGGVNVNLGDHVRVSGTATEFNGLTELGSVSSVLVCSTGNTVTPASVSLPVAAVSDLERYEGMLVSFSQTLTVTEVFGLGRFGEVALSGAGRLYTPTAVALPGAPAQTVAAQNDRSRIILDDGNNQQNVDPTRYPQGGLSAANTLRVGDMLPGLAGVMDFRFSNYRIQPVGPIAFNPANARTSGPESVGGNLKVASFNVLNYFNGDGVGGGFPTSRGANTALEFARQRAKEISALKAMNADIVGLMEMENDAPPNSAVEDLVAGLNDAMGAGTYSFINTGIIGTDEIKVALIYKPGAVSPVGAYKLMTSAVDPRFIDTLNRPSLAQTFRLNSTGGKLTVVVNHLKSKGSSCDAVGDPDTGDGQGNCNLTRKKAAEALADWLATDPTGSGDPDFLLIGDMNSYTFEDPITTFVNGGFRNLVREHGGLTPYSYVFDGESGYLDHALAKPSLADQVTGITDWHINPDEPTVLDYNVEFKTANQINTFYDPGPYRSSDHDPVIIGIALTTTNGAPTVSAGGPYSVAEGGSVTLSASGSDPDGDALTYEWDLDNNGTFETPGQFPTFSAAGINGPDTRTVVVRVSDGTDSATAQATVTITNAPPTVSAGGTYTVAEGGSVTVSAIGSDPGGDALTYEWDLDNNGTFETAGQSATFSAAAIDGPAMRTIAVRASDGTDSATAQATVNITNVRPTATFNAPEETFAGFPFTLSLTNPSDPASADTFTYAFDCGSGYGPFGTASSTTCPTTLPGERQVGGKIRDDDGDESEYRDSVQVVVTFDGLCSLVRRVVTSVDVANALCDKLTAAKVANDRGSRTGQLAAFRNQVDAQTGKSISPADAKLLKDLSELLQTL